MQNKTTIVINGRTYDAKTGTLLSGPGAGLHHNNDRPQPSTHHKKQFVDGFVRGSSLPASPTLPHAKLRNSAKPLHRDTHEARQEHRASAIATRHATSAGSHTVSTDSHTHTKSHPVAPHATAFHQKQHKSETLMRRAVKNPLSSEPEHRIQRKRGLTIRRPDQDNSMSARSILAEMPREKLAVKASTIDKSQTISHFGKAANSSALPVKLKTLDLKTPPTDSTPNPVQSEHESARTAPNHTTRHVNRSHAMLQRGLMAANSHEQHRIAYKKNTRRTLVSVGAGTLAALLLAGYIAYINIPNIAMKVAANKAGFSASLPESPSGYSMKGPIKYAPGRITFNLRSNSNDNTIAITERSSNWDSQTLLKNHVRPSSNGDYEAVEASGRTLYMFGQSVTWVHGGVWYQIDGNEQVNRDQLVAIATSM